MDLTIIIRKKGKRKRSLQRWQLAEKEKNYYKKTKIRQRPWSDILGETCPLSEVISWF